MFRTTTHSNLSNPEPRFEIAGRHPVVSFRNVTKTYSSGTAQVFALRNVSADIYTGEFTAIMGPSGSGKSTLMNIAAGLDDVTNGECFIAGEPLHRMDDTARTLLRRKHVGFIFQAFNLVPTLTAEENITLPFELAGRSVDAETRVWINELTRILGLAERRTHKPNQLSGGQQQRVAIARALAARPSIIFADEPTGNLDTRTGREVLTLLGSAAHEYGQSIAMVTHDPVAASFADRILVVADGEIVGDHPRLSPAEVSDLLISIGTGDAR